MVGPRGNEFVVDESDLPILSVTYPEHANEESLDAVWAEFVRVTGENRRIAFLLDVRPTNPIAVSARLRRYNADLHERFKNDLAKSTVCEARVVSSSLVRGLIIAFDWIKGDGLWPCNTFTSMAEARAWCHERLAEREH